MNARKLTVAVLVSLVAPAAALAFGSAAAFGELTHPYETQITGPSPTESFGDPWGLAFDPAGNLLVADAKQRAIDVFDPANAFVPPQFTSSAFTQQYTRSVAVAATGTVYVAESGPENIDVFKPAGANEYGLLEEDKFGYYVYVAVDNHPAGPSDPRAGDVYVLNGSLHVIKPGAEGRLEGQGEVVPHLGGFMFGAGGQAGLAVDAATGSVYVADPGDHVVDVFDDEGEEQPLLAITGAGTPAGASSFEPIAVAIDDAGEAVYVVDNANHVVDEFSTAGAFLGQVKRAASGSPLKEPLGVAVQEHAGLSKGEVYVSDGAAKAVDVFGAAPVVLPTVTTGAASGATETAATLSGTVNPSEVSVSACRFEYRTSAEATYTHSESCSSSPGSGNAAVAVSSTVGGLTANTTYRYRLAATNANGTNYGEEEELTTPGPPKVRAEAEVKSTEMVGQTTATLQAQVDPDGRATSYRFEYGETPSYGTAVPVPDGAAGSGEAFVPVPAAELSKLKVGTTYHYRVLATNEYGTTTGPDQEFTTAPAALIDSEAAAGVTTTSVTLQAQVNPLGSDTRYYFQYGTSATYSGSVPAPPGADIGSGESDVAVAVHLQGLAAGTVYHYRVVAVGEPNGEPATIDGSDETFTTQAAASEVMQPDGRRWELVSPPSKEGADIIAIGNEQGADTQAAAEGGGITYTATASFVANPAGNRAIETTQVISTRHVPGSWETADITTPHDAGPGGLAVGHSSEYKLFSSDLSLGLVEPAGPDSPLPPLPANAEQTVYLRIANGEYRAVVTAENVPSGTKFGDEVEFVSASPDLRHVVVGSRAKLTSAPKPASEGLVLYEWAGGELQLASVLPNGEPTAASLGEVNNIVRHAISNDGSRLVWQAYGFTEGNSGNFVNGHLYLRDMVRRETVPVDVAQGAPEPQRDVSTYKTASSDDSRVFFTSPERLTADSTAPVEGNGPEDLYEFEITSGKSEPLAGKPTDLTVDGNAEESAGVKGVIGASEDGSYVYFVAGGVLGDAAEHGAVAGGNNLYVERYDEEAKVWAAPRFIAALASGDSGSWNDNRLKQLTARVSPNGRFLAFMSERSLTGYENRDASSGVPDEEVFLYDASTGRLVCGSCDPTGARPVGSTGSESYEERLWDYAELWGGRWVAGDIPGWTTKDLSSAIYQSRYLSDSGRLFFNSSDALVPGDVNGKEDVYEYEPAGVGGCQGPTYGQSASVVYSESLGGCVGLISSGTSSEESAFMDASETGGDVFFLTLSKLSPLDYDTSIDMYDAHECTAFAPCAPAPLLVPGPCATGDACKPGPTPQPALYGEPSSETFSGAGNVVPSASAGVTPRSSGRGQELAKALKECRKKPKRKRAACERKARKRYGAVRSRVGESLSARAGR